jgi:energy-dependent translational throttle protein EttA
MYRCSKHVPPNRDVLRDISLSFYYGAKIGVIGPNGAGKSTLLRIMAGQDTDFTGEARLGDGYTVGLLEQEPRLDESKDVLGNIMDGVAQTQALLDRYNEVLAAWADPDADYDELGEEQAALEKKIEAADAWELDRKVAIAMDALRVPPADATSPPCPEGSAAGSPCAAFCSVRPTCCCSTSRPTTSMPNRWRGSSASSRTTRGR